jgi:hypothetical protein
MFIWTIQDLIGLVILALFLCLALLVWLLMLLARLRAWLRRKWTSFVSRWSRTNA